MKKILGLFILVGLVAMVSCKKKPDCQSKAGKAKKKHYNSIQYQ